jgi:2,4-dienoyl-CoA reductase-like NADH-dependent reductase (Old Yellow Enzyme family)
MAAMTRDRATPSGTPTDLNARYYAQRTSVGLIVRGCRPLDLTFGSGQPWSCSVSPTGRRDSTEKVVVNVRCLDGVQLGALEVQSFDGKNY